MTNLLFPIVIFTIILSLILIPVIGDDTKTFNFAAQSAGAVIVDKSPSTAKGFHNLLNNDKDKYGICPSREDKWIVIGLSEDILIKSVIIGTYEKYSSVIKDFQLQASTIYPTTNWVELGSYIAEPKLGEQVFNMSGSAEVHTRYLKIKILSHHFDEELFTISQIKVHGLSFIASLQQVELSNQDMIDKLNHLEHEELVNDLSTNNDSVDTGAESGNTESMNLTNALSMSIDSVVLSTEQKHDTVTVNVKEIEPVPEDSWNLVNQAVDGMIRNIIVIEESGKIEYTENDTSLHNFNVQNNNSFANSGSEISNRTTRTDSLENFDSFNDDSTAVPTSSSNNLLNQSESIGEESDSSNSTIQKIELPPLIIESVNISAAETNSTVKDLSRFDDGIIGVNNWISKSANSSSVAANCLDSLKFSDFKSRMLEKINVTTDEHLSHQSSLFKENVFRNLVHRINTLEMNEVIIEKYTVQVIY